MRRYPTAGPGGRRFAFAALLLPQLVSGTDVQTLQVEAKRCAMKIHVVARDVPLKDVLTRLATEMGFKLTTEGPVGDPVSIDRRGPPQDVLNHLLRGRNAVIHSAPDAHCGRETISVVSVLPAGSEMPGAPVVAPAAPVSTALPATEGLAAPMALERPPGEHHGMSSEEWQKRKRERAHANDGAPEPPRAER